MNDTQRDFYLQVAAALRGCQLVEQELKLYISEALALVAKLVGNKLPFSMKGEDYNDASLERLIEVFKKLSDAPSLVADLRKFKDERNFLSHKGISHCLDPDDELDFANTMKFDIRLNSIEPEAQRLREAIHDEANKFRASLWFDEHPNAG